MRPGRCPGRAGAISTQKATAGGLPRDQGDPAWQCHRVPGTSPAGTEQATGPPVAPHLPGQPCSGASTHGTILPGEGRGHCQLGSGTGGCPQPSGGAQSPHVRVWGGSGHPYPQRPAGCAPSPRSAAGGDARGCVRSSTQLRRGRLGAVGRDPLTQHSPPHTPWAPWGRATSAGKAQPRGTEQGPSPTQNPETPKQVPGEQRQSRSAAGVGRGPQECHSPGLAAWGTESPGDSRSWQCGQRGDGASRVTRAMGWQRGAGGGSTGSSAGSWWWERWVISREWGDGDSRVTRRTGWQGQWCVRGSRAGGTG